MPSRRTGPIYTPVPDSVGTEWTCYYLVGSILDDSQQARLDLDRRKWVAAYNDLVLAATEAATVRDYTTDALSRNVADASLWYWLAADAIERGYLQATWNQALKGDAATAQAMALAKEAGTSCTIPVLAGL